jgi:hypothetical protein
MDGVSGNNSAGAQALFFLVSPHNPEPLRLEGFFFLIIDAELSGEL